MTGDKTESTEPPVRWNLNIHYHPRFLEAAKDATGRVLEVGCGDGLLTFELAEAGHRVLAIDQDAPSIERANADPRSDGVEFVCADLFEHDFVDERFDLVAANAVLHHLDAKPALQHMKGLVAPGGRLVLVSFGTLSSVGDVSRAMAGRLVKFRHRRAGPIWNHNAPMVWPPPHSIADMETLAAEVLPGCRFDRLLSSRFAIDWTAPA